MGEVDILWAIIFILIIATFIYWCYIIFTDRRHNQVKADTLLPANPNQNISFQKLKQTNNDYNIDSDSSADEYYILDDSDNSDNSDDSDDSDDSYEYVEYEYVYE